MRSRVSSRPTGYLVGGRRAPAHAVPDPDRGGPAGLRTADGGAQERRLPAGGAAPRQKVDDLQGAGDRAARQPPGDRQQVPHMVT